MHRKSLWLVFALATVLLLAPLPLGAMARHWPALTNSIENAGHPLVFWLLTTHVLRAVKPRSPSVAAAYALTFIGVLSFGLATELIQSLVGRDASWEDARNDAIGALFALALCARGDLPQAGRARWRPAATLLAAGLAVLAMFPLTWTVSAYAWRWQAFPLLWSPDAVLAQRLSHWKRDAYPGLVLEEPANDWRGYGALQVNVRSLRDSGAEIHIRVHDRQHNQQFLDRFDKAYVLPDSRPRMLTIPLESIRRGPAARELDLSAVRSVIIFQEGQREERRFEVGEIRLVR